MKNVNVNVAKGTNKVEKMAAVLGRGGDGGGIDREIRALIGSLESNISEELVVVRESPDRRSSCRGLVCVYRRADIKRQQREQAEAARNHVGARVRSAFRAAPVKMYAFYASVYDSGKIGSVAIYGDTAVEELVVGRLGYFLGHKVKSSSIEMGRRPFFKVCFVA